MRKTDKTIDIKTENTCISCPYRFVKCHGLRTSEMKLKRWCEYMREMRILENISIEEVSRRSDVSEKTISRLMKYAIMSDEEFEKIEVQDIHRETARRIEEAIIGSTYPHMCYMMFAEEQAGNEEKLNAALCDLEKALADNNDRRTLMENLTDSFNTELVTVRAEAQKKIDHLLQELSAAHQTNEKLGKELDNLWQENQRKSKLLDKFIEKL